MQTKTPASPTIASKAMVKEAIQFSAMECNPSCGRFTHRIAITALAFCLASFAFLPSIAMAKRTPQPAPARNIVMQPELQMGSLTLHPCSYALQAYCGSLDRALDPTGQVAGTIHIHFEVDPHSDTTQPPLETLVAAEGGPGYGSTNSRAGYLAMFGPLLARHDLVLMDQRGTGYSQAVDCPALQLAYNITQPGVQMCGAQLGNQSDLYGTGAATDDLAALLDALGAGQINLYGDSYGTFFSQTFSARHPERLRSLMLDGAYPVKRLSPWYPQIGASMRFAYDSACHRSSNCADIPGTPIERLATLVEQVRKAPFSGWAPDANGVQHFVTVNPANLDYLSVSDGLYYPLTRETDPAVRAYLEDGDTLPLLRLVAENIDANLTGGPGAAAQSLSNGLFVAVSCSDYPQIYDMTSPPSARPTQRQAAFAEMQLREPNIYYPFTLEEFAAAPLDISVLDLCLTWPVPSPNYPPGQPIPPGANFTTAPVLVLSGDMDTLTPAGQGSQVIREYAHAQHVIVANTFHVSAIGDEDDCAQELIRKFVRDLNPGDTSCARNIAEVRMVPKFAKLAAQLDPATALAGNKGTDADLRVAAAAAYTVGDALDLWWANLSGSGVGLRGGKWGYASNGDGSIYNFKLDQMKWVKDVTVSGSFTWAYFKPGAVNAKIHVTGPGAEVGDLTISFNSRDPKAQATITGMIGGRQIVATMYAP